MLVALKIHISILHPGWTDDDRPKLLKRCSEEFDVQNRLNGQINLCIRFIWLEIKAQTNKNIKWTKLIWHFKFCLTLNVSKFYFYSWKLVFTSVTLLSRVKTGLNCPGNFIWVTLFFCLNVPLNVLYKSGIIFRDFLRWFF